jgi:hypothetical protein
MLHQQFFYLRGYAPAPPVARPSAQAAALNADAREGLI